MKEYVKTERGITLVSLVVTIIILIILAGVSINMIIGQDGIITIARRAKENMELARIEEETQLNELYAQLGEDGTLGGLDYDVITKFEEFKKVIAEAITSKGIETSADDSKETMAENIKKIGGSSSGDTEEPGKGDKSGANEPSINGFDLNNTYYVTWNLNEEKTEYVIDQKKMSENVAPSNWYDYTEGVNHYANIKTTGGGNDCYWVWIPRYAYCITEGYHSNTAGTIDIKFLKGTTNTPMDGSNITISNSSGYGNWNVHPAFWWDKDDDGIQDEGEQLTGIWVAKFEASSSSVSESTLQNDLKYGGGNNNTKLQVRVKPNVTSWRRIGVYDIFTVCRNITEAGNSLENTTNLNSHMMKNTEWGAVAYLSRSIYGKNSEVWKNPYYYNTTSYSPVTGLCGKGTNDERLSTTDITNTYKYNEVGGGNASTTGNVYGIYDMAGGAAEFVAAYLDGLVTIEATIGNAELKYKDVYERSSAGSIEQDYNASYKKYGDALYETSDSGSSDTGSWGLREAWLPNGRRAWFARGGSSSGKMNGIFSFYNYDDSTWPAVGFRPVLIYNET